MYSTACLLAVTLLLKLFWNLHIIGLKCLFSLMTEFSFQIWICYSSKNLNTLMWFLIKIPVKHCKRTSQNALSWNSTLSPWHLGNKLRNYPNTAFTDNRFPTSMELSWIQCSQHYKKYWTQKLVLVLRIIRVLVHLNKRSYLNSSGI